MRECMQLCVCWCLISATPLKGMSANCRWMVVFITMIIYLVCLNDLVRCNNGLGCGLGTYYPFVYLNRYVFQYMLEESKVIMNEVLELTTIVLAYSIPFQNEFTDLRESSQDCQEICVNSPSIVLLHVAPQSKLGIKLLVTRGTGEGSRPPVDGLHVVPLHRAGLEGSPAHLTQEWSLLRMCCLKYYHHNY